MFSKSLLRILLNVNGIEIKNLEKYYGNFAALRGISLNVAVGEIVGLLGPNGAGKTTTLRIAATYLLPSAGEVKIGGVDAVKNPVEARKILGYMPENPPMYPQMRVKNFLKFVGTAKGIPRGKITERLEYVRYVCKLEEVWDRFVGQISRGYRQRVGLAAAIISDPPVLILDEPTAGLDPEQIRYTRQVIKTLGEDHAVLLSTHILHEAEQLCDRVEIIHRGKIIASGNPRQLAAEIHTISAVRVKFSVPPSEAIPQLRDLDGVLEITTLHEGKILVEFEPRWKVHEKIPDIAAQNQWKILELSPIESSLEDVFHDLLSRE